MAETPEIADWDGECGIGAFRNVTLQAWFGMPTIARLDRVLAFERALVRRYPGGIGIVTWVVQTDGYLSGLPAEVRKRVADVSAEIGPNTRALGQLVEGGGFWNATVRSILSAATLLQRNTHPTKVFDTIEPCAAWMAPLLGGGPRAGTSVEELRGALVEFSRAIRARRGGG